jgi:two-component system sensor histidine kinase QseC
MTLQRRLILTLLICAPLVWALAFWASAHRARTEVNEIFDTEMIQLARQVQATLDGVSMRGRRLPEVSGRVGKAEVRDLAIAVWSESGEQVLVDEDGVLLPFRAGASGFSEMSLQGATWRVYTLPADAQGHQVAVGQSSHERDELVWWLVASQLLPWLMVLPVLLLTMAWAVRKALVPLRALAQGLAERDADDLSPVSLRDPPGELRPLLGALNGLFERIDRAIRRERRFTADAAHELRTPIAVLRAQFDVLRGARNEAERLQAQARLGAGIDRMDRLFAQILALSRVDSTDRLLHAVTIAWPAIVEDTFGGVLELADRRRMELECEWPAAGTEPFALQGDPDLIGVLLRNLVDNAVRYGTEGTRVSLRFSTDALEVLNAGDVLSAEQLRSLGERFHRPPGQLEPGSGLGVSIAQRVAALHGLRLEWGADENGRGVRVRLTR